MTKQQLDALIKFIDECATYRAYAVDDDEWPARHMRDAEDALRAAFRETDGER